MIVNSYNSDLNYFGASEKGMTEQGSRNREIGLLGLVTFLIEHFYAMKHNFKNLDI